MARPSNASEITAIIYESFKTAKQTCTSPLVLDYSHVLSNTHIHFHELLVILSAVALILSSIIALYLVLGHLFHWTRPKEQKQIVRICLFVPAFSLCAFWSTWFYHAAGYITPFGQWYEAFALNALFLLYVQIATPDATHREQFFQDLERKWYSGKKKGNHGSLRWFRGLYVMVFQLFFVRIGTVLSTELLYGLTCPLSEARAHGQTAITTIQSTSTVVAVWGCILLEKRLHSILHEHLGLLKLVSFKVVIVLDAIQEVVFPSLAEYRVFRPSPPWRVSWNDFAIGLPQFLLSWEMLIVAIFFLWSFDFTRYRRHVLLDRETSQASPRAAMLDVLNIADIWQGVVYAFFGKKPSSWSSGAHHEIDQAATHLSMQSIKKEEV